MSWISLNLTILPPMTTFTLLLGLFSFWALFGSFCGVLMDEPVKGRSFWTGRSECLRCHHILRWHELIPIVSYFLQKGRCRECHCHIPISVIYIEVLMAFLWMILGWFFVAHWYGIAALSTHLVCISCLVMLALVDLKSLTIPDRLSLPMIVIVLIALSVQYFFAVDLRLPSFDMALWWALFGMSFYMIQMLAPAMITVIRQRDMARYIDLLLFPFVTPLWLVARILLWEKYADRMFPSFMTIDDLPTWVGGWDIRLGILVWLILGPVSIAWSIGIGYTAGSLFYCIRKLIFKKDLTVLPVAPLILIGVCVTWVVRVYVG